ADSRGNGSSGSFTVAVRDTTPPSISGMPSDMTVAPGSPATWASPTATDLVDGAVQVACSPASGTVLSTGSTHVTCSATDAHGHTAAAGFTATARGNTPPVMRPPAHLVRVATSAIATGATWSARATDAV